MTGTSRRLVVVAVLAGSLTAVAVALWALEVIGLPVLVGLMVAVGVVELAVLLPLIRRDADGREDEREDGAAPGAGPGRGPGLR